MCASGTATSPRSGQMADDVRELLSAGFRNEKHKAQWKSTAGNLCCQPLRAKPVDTIGTDDVLSVLKPIWTEKAETASRVRGQHREGLGRGQGQQGSGTVKTPPAGVAIWIIYCRDL